MTAAKFRTNEPMRSKVEGMTVFNTEEVDTKKAIAIIKKGQMKKEEASSSSGETIGAWSVDTSVSHISVPSTAGRMRGRRGQGLRLHPPQPTLRRLRLIGR